MSNLTDEQNALLLKQQNQRIKANARAKKYYDANKEKVKNNVQQRRANEKKMLDEIQTQTAIGIDTNNVPIAEPEPEPEVAPVVESLHMNANGTKRSYTLDECIAFIMADDLIADSSKNTNVSGIKRFFKVNKCKSLTECLIPSKYKQSLQRVEDSTGFSSSGNAGTYQVLSKLLNVKRYNAVPSFSKTHNETLLKFVNHKYDIWKAIVRDEQVQKSKDMIVPTFVEYLGKVRQKFGEESRQFLIAYLYSLVTLRDDFQDMKIIQYVKEGSVGLDNFILHKKDNTTFYINSYKTEKRYGRYVRKLDLNKPAEKKLHYLISKHFEREKLGYGKLFLGKSALSATVSKLHKKLGYKYKNVGITLFRNMRVSQTLGGETLSVEERKKLSDEMHHSLSMQLKYQRPTKSLVKIK
jgi:hypothetical protein